MDSRTERRLRVVGEFKCGVDPPSKTGERGMQMKKRYIRKRNSAAEGTGRERGKETSREDEKRGVGLPFECTRLGLTAGPFTLVRGGKRGNRALCILAD
jgi:hypothetical protein